MIFENERNIPCVNDWIGFLAVWLNACASNWNEKNTRFHIIFCWMVLLGNKKQKTAASSNAGADTSQNNAGCAHQLCNKSVNQLNTSTRQKTTTNFKRNKKCNGTWHDRLVLGGSVRPRFRCLPRWSCHFPEKICEHSDLFRRYCTVCITIGKQSTPLCLNCEVTIFFCHDRCGVSAEHERCNLLCWIDGDLSGGTSIVCCYSKKSQDFGMWGRLRIASLDW